MSKAKEILEVLSADMFGSDKMLARDIKKSGLNVVFNNGPDSTGTETVYLGVKADKSGDDKEIGKALRKKLDLTSGFRVIRTFHSDKAKKVNYLQSKANKRFADDVWFIELEKR